MFGTGNARRVYGEAIVDSHRGLSHHEETYGNSSKVLGAAGWDKTLSCLFLLFVGSNEASYDSLCRCRTVFRSHPPALLGLLKTTATKIYQEPCVLGVLVGRILTYKR